MPLLWSNFKSNIVPTESCLHFESRFLTIKFGIIEICITYYVLSIMYKKISFFFIIVFIIHATCYMLHATPAQALTMSNENYVIKTEDFNVISGVTENDDYKLKSTTGDLNTDVSEGVNFKVKTGFENVVSTLPFSVSLGSDIIDFGILSPTNPIIRTVDLATHSLAVYGYSVLVFENEPLTATSSSDKTFIPDTTCDKGDCGVENAAEWKNTLAYGFGYRCDNTTGADCDNTFSKIDFYKHFPDILNNDDPQSIMAGIGSNDRKTRISYRANVSQAQSQGTYSNIITYLGIPNY
jgi:hypothetical protein